MRWDGQRLGASPDGALPELALAGLVRSVRTPEFAGVTFHEVAARSALNKVPATSSMPFRWTINPMRGCLHACGYCYARPTHEYLDLGAGEDFETQIVVKANIVEVLQAELARPSWRGEHVALGTNTDPYQRAEGRYRLMPGIIGALTDARTPFSILTKGTLLRRDLPLLARSAGAVPVGLAVSLAFLDEGLQQLVEPGTPTPRARLDLIRAVRDAGLPCGVFVAPVLPWLTDSTAHLGALLEAIADAGATGVTVLPMHLRGSVKPLFLGWLASERPDLVAGYRRLYGGKAYVHEEYRTWLGERVEPMLQAHGFGSAADRRRDGVLRAEEGSFPRGSMPLDGGEAAARSASGRGGAPAEQPALF